MANSRTVKMVVLCLSMLLAQVGAQEKPQPGFACEGNAARIDLETRPSLEFVALDIAPGKMPDVAQHTGHHFEFEATPIGYVRLYVTATLPEEPVAREAYADLTVYVEVAATAAAASRGESKWWQLVPSSATRTRRELSASSALRFDAKRIANCFGGAPEGAQCAFAEFSRATSDPKVPMVVMGFTLDQGGANANNWEDARLLLDFRTATPRVAVTADCGYNEGGGACTAIDAEPPRSGFTCEWAAGVNDFLCTEANDYARRDFYLLSERVPPLRPSELPTMRDAAVALAKGKIGDTVTVGRHGVVRWIHDLALDSRNRVMVLSSSGSFFFAQRRGGAIDSIVGLRSRPLGDPYVPPQSVGSPEGQWTEVEAASFNTREISRDRRLVVLQLVETSSDQPTALHWVGIERGGRALAIDALRLVAEGVGKDGDCGEIFIPAAVAAVEGIDRPFAARVRVRPPVEAHVELDDLTWHDPDRDPDQEPSSQCVRTGSVRWRQGRFDTIVDQSACADQEDPVSIAIDVDGRLRPRTPQDPPR